MNKQTKTVSGRKKSRKKADVVKGRLPVRHTRKASKARRRRTSETQTLIDLFDGSKGRFGLALGIVVEQRQGDEIVSDTLSVTSFAAKPGRRPRSRLLDLADESRTAALLAGLAHPDRIRLARAMAIGACTHDALSMAVKLKTGPLYHHLRELERAGVSESVARNTYGLTAAGRLALIVSTGLGAGVSKRNPWKHKAKRGRSVG